MSKSRFRLAMRLIGPILIIWVVWRFADMDLLVDTLAHADLSLLALAAALDAVLIHSKLWRWHRLLEAAYIRMPMTSAYRAYLPSLFLGLVTPGRV